MQAHNNRSSRPAGQGLPERVLREQRVRRPVQEQPGQAERQVSVQRQSLESQQVWQQSQRSQSQQVAEAEEKRRRATQPAISKTFSKTFCTFGGRELVSALFFSALEE
jgi:hypothetical protein